MDMDKQKLIDGLNEDLSKELGAAIRYMYQTAIAEGFNGEELRDILRPDIGEEIAHATYLMDKIVALGGTPNTVPADFEKHADVKKMLEYDLKMERADIEGYKKRVEQADAVGEVGLKVKLEDIIAEETDHAEQIERILRGLK
jgi:bacterioferritin